MTENGTMERTLQRLAAQGARTRKPFVMVAEGRMQVGVSSTHLSRSGRLYNGLLRIYRRSRYASRLVL